MCMWTFVCIFLVELVGVNLILLFLVVTWVNQIELWLGLEFNNNFCKSCGQTLVLVKVLSGLLLSQQEKEEYDWPQPTPPKWCKLMLKKFAPNITRLSPKLWWSLILKTLILIFIGMWPLFMICASEIPSHDT